MIVVSNAGPIIALAQIDQLPLLSRLFGRVRIPSAVHDELISISDAEIAAAAIEVVKMTSREGIQVLQERLDVGESETIILAGELRADLILMDEARGRRVCEARGLRYTGTLGVLLLAKQNRFIEGVTPYLDQLASSGFFMSEELYAKAQMLAGEAKT